MTPERRDHLSPPGAGRALSRSRGTTPIRTIAASALVAVLTLVAPVTGRAQSGSAPLEDPVPANLYTQFPDDELAWWPDARQTEVYQVNVNDPSLYSVGDNGIKTISVENASEVCRTFGTELATPSQLDDAYDAGANWCACGILSDGTFAFPIQTPSEGCGSKAGVQICGSGWSRNRATCYGVKPATATVAVRDSQNSLRSFAGGRWSQYCNTEGSAGCPPAVQSVDENDSVTGHTISRLQFAAPVPVPYQQYGPTPPTALAKGRFISNDADQLVAMTKTGGYTVGEDCNSFEYGLAGFIDPSVSKATFPSWSDRPCLASRKNWEQSPFDLAAGDLDRAMDAHGELHDELVIVSEVGNAGISPPGMVRIRVLDYSADPANPAETSYTLPSDDAHAYDRLAYNTAGGLGVLLAETFDAGGNGAKLVATAHSATQPDGVGFVVNVLSYTPPESAGGTGTITPIGDWQASVSYPGAGFGTSADLAAGDLDGDGDEELALAYIGYDGAHVVVLTAAPGQGVKKVSEWNDTSLGSTTASSVALVSGVFYFDPGKGFDLGRRQLALGTSVLPPGSSGSIGLKVLRFDGASKVENVKDLTQHPPTTVSPQINLAAGNFAGTQAQPANPIWSLAVGFASGESSQSVLFIDPSTGEQTDSIEEGWSTQIPSALLAFDQHGDSLYLGAPVTFQVDRPQQLLSTLQQPPQHLDYLPNGSGASKTTGLLNVSRYPGFQLVFTDEKSSTLTSDQSSAFSWTSGGSVAGSASVTITEKIPLIEKASLKGGVSGLVDYVHANSSTSSAGNSSSVTVEMSQSPVNDDALYLTMQRYEIWRYRLYGAQTDDPQAPNAYYEVFKPMGLTTKSWFGGLDVDAYQPLHENGNILSYPDIYENDPGSPPDLGSWSPTELPPDCDQPAPPGTSYETPLTETTILQFNGNESVLEVSLDKSHTCGGQLQSSDTLKESGDFRATVTAKENEIFAKEEEKGWVNFHVSGCESWADLSAWNTTTEESEDLVIATVETGDSDFDYSFAPSLYFADNGNLKVAFYTSTPGQTQDWWGTTYSLPDPALNLPRKFIAPNNDDWQLNTSMNARRIRGFHLRDGSAIDPETGLGPLLASIPEHGDKVQVEVKVYNYSVRQQFSSLPVRFDIADYDSVTDSVSNRRVLGTVTAQFTDEHDHRDGPPKCIDTGNGSPSCTVFPPRGVGRAVYTVDTSTLPNPQEGVSDYVIYAVLDPDGSSYDTETHPWRDVNVYVVPYTQGQENVGALLELTLSDPAGTTSFTVQATSAGNVPQDILTLAREFNENPTAKEYRLLATAYPAQTPQAQPETLVLSADNPTLPSPSGFGATLAFAEAVSGVSAFDVVPSVTGGADATMTASNLAPGQNNEGYGFLAVAGSGSDQGAATLTGVTLSAADLSGRIVDGQASGAAGDPLRLRLCAEAAGVFRSIVDVPVFLGDPANGEGLAVKRLYGVDRDGSCAWFDWTPPAAGRYTVQTVLPHGATAAQTALAGSLTVQVQ